MTHTPAPWKFENLNQELEYDPSYEVTAPSFMFVSETRKDFINTLFDDTCYYPTAPSKEDAEHIVRCVNSHDELIAALEDAEPLIWDACDGYYRSGMFKTMDEALEKYHTPIVKLISKAKVDQK